jgi:hypothetical protein
VEARVKKRGLKPGRLNGAVTLSAGQDEAVIPIDCWVLPPTRGPAKPPAGQAVHLADLAGTRIKARMRGGKPAEIDGAFETKERAYKKLPDDMAKSDIALFRAGRSSFKRGFMAMPCGELKNYAGKVRHVGVDGKAMDRELSVAAGFDEITVDLTGSGFKAFSAEVADYSLEKGLSDRGGATVFEIWVDGALRACSGPVGIHSPPRLLFVDGLKGANELKLVTVKPHGRVLGQRRRERTTPPILYPCWAEPRLWK